MSDFKIENSEETENSDRKIESENEDDVLENDDENNLMSTDGKKDNDSGSLDHEGVDGSYIEKHYDNELASRFKVGYEYRYRLSNKLKALGQITQTDEEEERIIETLNDNNVECSYVNCLLNDFSKFVNNVVCLHTDNEEYCNKNVQAVADDDEDSTSIKSQEAEDNDEEKVDTNKLVEFLLRFSPKFFVSGLKLKLLSRNTVILKLNIVCTRNNSMENCNAFEKFFKDNFKFVESIETHKINEILELYLLSSYIMPVRKFI